MGLFRRKRPEASPAATLPTTRPNPGPSWMPSEEWEARLQTYRQQGRSAAEIRGIAEHLQKRGPRKPRTRDQGVARSHEFGVVTRAVYVPADDEAVHLVRSGDGLPVLRLVDSGDRLSVWSPVGGGALINPKGAGLRQFGLITTNVRGNKHYASADRAADLRKGRPVELRREPDNPHDRNAVAMYAPGAHGPFGYVQKGRAPAIARRMDGGESLGGVSLRGPGPRTDVDSAFVLIGSTADIAAIRG